MLDDEIVQAIRSDANRGFGLLLAKYKEPVYWHIRRVVVRHDDAQDATQEAFVRIYRSFGGYDDSKPLSAWVYRIATNEALRMVQRRQAQATVDLDAANCEGLFADEWVDYGDVEAVRLQKAILALPAKQQLAFNMRYYDELSYHEIAEVLQTSETSVRMNYNIAKQKIINYFKQL